MIIFEKIHPKSALMVDLSDLENSRFKFYLNDSFRRHVFQILKKKYKRWNIVAKKLEVNQRALFGLRRGYNYKEGTKKLRFIRSNLLFKICQLLEVDVNSIQSNVQIVEIGNRKENITFPLKVRFDEDITSLRRAISEFVYSNYFESKLKHLEHPFRKEENCITIDFRYFKKYFYNKVEKMRLQGLTPRIKQNNSLIEVSYRIPGTNKRKNVILPKKIVFNEIFAKEFGKWMGDRAGGPHKVGVSNKELSFINDFKVFLSNTLLQLSNQIKIVLSCRPDFTPSEELRKCADLVEVCKTQYGNFGFSVIISNYLLRSLIFDDLEKYWFEILYDSSKEVRFAFYSGLFEAEGSRDGNMISWAFGYNLNGNINNEFIRALLEKATKLKFLLNYDGFDSILSRKLSLKSKTLKYDVRVFRNFKQRELELDLFKGLVKYVSHPIKLSKSKDLIYSIENGGKTKMADIDKRLIPEVNIGTLGH